MYFRIITYRTLKERFYHKSVMPYEYEILLFKSFENPIESWELERRLHKLNKHNKYIPKIHFDGFSECFSIIDNYAQIH